MANYTPLYIVISLIFVAFIVTAVYSTQRDRLARAEAADIELGQVGAYEGPLVPVAAEGGQ